MFYLRTFGEPELALATLDLAGVVDAIIDLVEAGNGGYVVTANVDHLVLLRNSSRFRRAYQGAALRTIDGSPVAILASILSRHRVRRVTGADLVRELVVVAEMREWKVAIAGGATGVATQAALRMRASLPRLAVEGIEAGLVESDAAGPGSDRLARSVASTDAALLLLGLGSPKQEVWASGALDAGMRTVVICCGAGVDFLAGSASRAPTWIRSLGFEWLYRLFREPRRLWRRYLVRDSRFVAVAIGELLARCRRSVHISRNDSRVDGEDSEGCLP